MSWVDEVKSPLDDDKFLEDMILLYARQSSGTKRSGSYIYEELIMEPESEKDADHSAYLKNFKKYVEQDTVCMVLTKALGYSQEDAIKIYMDLFLDEKDEDEPLTIDIDKGELVSKLEDIHILETYYDESYMQMSVKDLLKKVFHAEGLMGYHIYKSKFGNVWDGSDSIVKFYINVGEDTYEFSKLFKQKSEEHDLNYAYKVVNPEKYEEKRADKMCIYMGLRDVEEYTEIIREIREEHPEFDYKDSSPLMGSIDDWIGVGADPDNFAYARSYNESRAFLIENALRLVFGNISEKKIRIMLEKNRADTIEKLRAEIERSAKDYFITKHFVFDDVIVDALSKPQGERISEYYKNRNQLFNNLPSEEGKKSIWGRIKIFLEGFRRKKSKARINNIDVKQMEMPITQQAYPGTETQEESKYKAGLRLNPDMLKQIPITQETVIGINDDTKIVDDDFEHDDSDVWL